MTTAPDRPLHHAHLGDENPFELIPSPWGHIERWRASTLSTGTMGALQSVYEVVRTDSAALAARADEAEVRNALVRNLCSKVNDFEHRFADLEARLAAAEAKRLAADAVAHQRQEEEQEPIELPPDFLEDETFTPTGELHAWPPKEEHDPEDPEP